MPDLMLPSTDSMAEPAASAQEAEQHLLLEIDKAIRYGLTVVAILDPASFESAWAQFGAISIARGGGSLFATGSQSDHRSVAPLLLPLVEGDANTHAALVKVARHTPAVVWLASDLPLEDLPRAMSAKLHAELADGRQPITLRYYDPRVLPELLRLLDQAQLNALNTGVRFWWWFDRSNAPAHFMTSPSHATGGHEVLLESVIALSTEQTERLLDASFVDRVVDLAMRSTPELLRPFDRGQRHLIAVRMIEAASGHGLTSEFDCANYIAVAMTVDEKFAENPDWAGLMADVRAGSLRFTEAIERWEERRANA